MDQAKGEHPRAQLRGCHQRRDPADHHDRAVMGDHRGRSAPPLPGLRQAAGTRSAVGAAELHLHRDPQQHHQGVRRIRTPEARPATVGPGVDLRTLVIHQQMMNPAIQLNNQQGGENGECLPILLT